MKGEDYLNLNNIYVDLEVKNYIHMCELLNEKVREGNSKKSQLSHWKCYFDYRKRGNKFIITDIYDTSKPLPKRGGSREIIPYIPNVKELIIQLLLYTGNNKVVLPKNRLLVALDMINDNYRLGKKNIEALSKLTSIDKMTIYDFYSSTDGMLANNIEKSLNELHNKRAVYWRKVYMVSKNNKIEEATDEEYKLILKVQSEILKEMDFEGLLQVFRAGRIEEFTRKSNGILSNESEIQFIYEAYSIILNVQQLEYVFEKMMKDKIRELGESVNIQVKERVLTNSTRRHEKIVAKNDEWFGIPDEKRSYRLDDTYLDKQLKLADVLIDIAHPPIF